MNSILQGESALDVLVSVVIPIYKTEKYLNRCIESVVNQTYKHLEIILVDDGSPDNCPQMCDEWATRDHRIKVIHKKNAGLGMARNTGIEYASGTYICFFDSDDYVELDAIELACKAAVENDADMVCYGLSDVDVYGKKIRRMIPKASPEVYRGEAVRKIFLPRLIGPDPKTGDNFNFSMSAWSKMFSMRSIRKNGWRFVSEREILSEDYYSVVDLCATVETAFVLPTASYNYCQNNESVSRSYRADRFEQTCHFYEEIKKLCETHGYVQDVLCRLGGVYLSLVITAMKQEVASDNKMRKKRKAIREMLNNEELQHVLEERKKDKNGLKKKMLFWAIRHRWTGLCYLFVFAQNART